MSGSSAALPDLWDAERPLPRGRDRLRFGLYVGLGLLITIFLCATFIPIGGVVLGTGKVGVESRVKRISHPFGGVITQITVANGDHVQKGQVLLRFDDSVTGADAAYSQLTVEQLFAQRARLEAERLGSNAISFPNELLSSQSDGARRAVLDEQKLFELRRAEERQLRAQITSKIVQLRHEVTGTQAQVAALQKQRRLLEPERRGVRELWEKGLVTINRLNQIERTDADFEGQLAFLGARISQTNAQIHESQERLVQISQTRRVEAGAELSRVMSALNDQRSRSVAAGDQQHRTEVRAPYAGIVEKLAFAAVGDVVRAAEPIMELVPKSEPMIVEVMISPADIDRVRVDQIARVRFSAFNAAATPEINGKVAYVATDRTEPSDRSEPYYIARIAVDQGQLRREGLVLRSGMPAEVHIETGSRSMLSYLTKPLRDQFTRAFRDD